MKSIILSLFLLFSLSMSAQWVLADSMSEGKTQFDAVKWGDDLWFIGGNTGGNNWSSKIEVFDTQNEIFKTPLNFSSPRRFVEAVAGDSAIYIVGGQEDTLGGIRGTDIVDIYKNGNWSTYTLPDSVFLTTLEHVGSKIIIFGGTKSYENSMYEFFPYIVMYDELTDVWTIDTMEVPRVGAEVATNGEIAMFAGGITGYNEVTDRIDVYNSTTGEWTTNQLSEARTGASAAYADGKYFFAGGSGSFVTGKDVVDIWDGTKWLTPAKLHERRAFAHPAVTDSKIFFTGGGPLNLHSGWFYSNSTAVVDVYDIQSETWKWEYMNYERINHAAIGHKEKGYVAGGVEIGLGIHKRLEITDNETGIYDRNFSEFKLYPNPALNHLNIKGWEKVNGKLNVRIINAEGRLVHQGTINEPSIDISMLNPGMYSIYLEGNGIQEIQRFVKE